MVLGLVKLNLHLFWPAVLVATVGNTLGGMLTLYGMGYGAERAYESGGARPETRALRWLQRLRPRACLLSWLPVVGDPLCAVAGWLKLPFWPCSACMAIGKFARYLTMTAGCCGCFRAPGRSADQSRSRAPLHLASRGPGRDQPTRHAVAADRALPVRGWRSLKEKHRRRGGGGLFRPRRAGRARGRGR